MWNEINCKSVRDYHGLYSMVDVLQLADVFEIFRNVCMKHYKLDPCWYYLPPGLSSDALLKMTGVELDLLTDTDMLLMIESGLRGGIYMCNTS